MSVVARDALAFDVREAGPTNGVPVVLLHGFPQAAEAWDAQLAALAGAGYHASAPDQRGYSPAARPLDAREYRLPTLVADALAVVNHTGAERVHLVGHDWGGAVAWAFAAMHPERLRSLTVVSTPHPGAYRRSLVGTQLLRSGYMLFFRTPWLSERLLLAGNGAVLRAMLVASGLPRDHADGYVRRMREPGALTAALNWYRALGPSAGSAIGRVDAPTMYVWSTGDGALGRAAAERTRGWVDGPYRFEVLEGASHWIPETRADELTALLLDHVSNY